MSVFGGCSQDESASGAVPAWPFLQDGSIFVHVFQNISEYFWVKNFEMGGWPHPLMQGHACLLDVVSVGSLSPLLHVSAKAIPMESWEPFISLTSGIQQWLYTVPHPPLLHIIFNILILCPSLLSPAVPDIDP